MLSLRIKVFILLQLVFGMQVFGQTIVVKDTLFANELCEDFPLAMDATCRLLDTVAAKVNYGSAPIEFKAFNLGITDASELKYFTGIDSIYLNKNKLKSFIPLSYFPALRRLHLPFNELIEAPEINYSNSTIQLVFIQDNQITTLPDDWNQPNTNIFGINISNNLLRSVPDFEGNNNMALLYVYGNHLNFSHLKPLKSHLNYNNVNWKLFPQKPFFIMDDTEVDFEKELTISVKEKESGNTYFLYHNNSLSDSNQTGDFVFAVSEDEAGTYKVVVKNELFTNEREVLESQKIKISVKYPNQVKEDDVLLFSPNGDGVGDELFIPGNGECVIYDASGSEVIKGQLPYLWNGQNNSGSSVGPGMYYIKTGEEFLKVLLSF